jgi:uncharacterized protein (DUF433 family)
MNIPVEAVSVPLWEDEQGGLRIGESRVQLEWVLVAHAQGARPEDIVDMYSALELADVYAVLAWALRHPADVEAYQRKRDESAAAIRRKLEDAGMVPGSELKDKLLTRQAQREQGNAPPSD